MKLYRIRRKDNGKFFANWIAPWSERWHGAIYWSADGCFFKKVDTCIAHIKLICSDWKIKDNTYSNLPKNRVINKFDRKKLKLYEVVISNVALRGEEVIDAVDLIKRKHK